MSDCDAGNIGLGGGGVDISGDIGHDASAFGDHGGYGHQVAHETAAAATHHPKNSDDHNNHLVQSKFNNGQASWAPTNPVKPKNTREIVYNPAVAPMNNESSTSSLKKIPTKDSVSSREGNTIQQASSRQRSSTFNSKTSASRTPLQTSRFSPTKNNEDLKTTMPKRNSHSHSTRESEMPKSSSKGRSRGFSFNSSSIDPDLPEVFSPKYRKSNSQARRETPPTKPPRSKPAEDASQRTANTSRSAANTNTSRRTNPVQAVSPPVSSTNIARSKKKENTRQSDDDNVYTEYPTSSASSVIYTTSAASSVIYGGNKSNPTRTEPTFSSDTRRREREDSHRHHKDDKRRQSNDSKTTKSKGSSRDNTSSIRAQRPDITDRVSSKGKTSIFFSIRRHGGEYEKPEKPKRHTSRVPNLKTVSEESNYASPSAPTHRHEHKKARSVNDIEYEYKSCRYNGDDEEDKKHKEYRKAKGTVSEEVIKRNIFGLRSRTTTVTRKIYDSDEWPEVSSSRTPKQKPRKGRERM